MPYILKNHDMKNFIQIILLCVLSMPIFAQTSKFHTSTGTVYFSSIAPLETIESSNRQVLAIFEPSTGKMAFKVLMKSFVFEKAAMQDHFNKNYLHTDKYPNATFDGTIKNIDAYNFSRPGSYKVEVLGNLNIHGITKELLATGLVIVKDESITLQSSFPVNLADFGVKIPANFVNNISKSVQVRVDCELLPK